MRDFSNRDFNRAFADVVLSGSWQEEPSYYPRYRTRYQAVLERFAALAPPRPIEVLEVGGGQLAALAAHLWGDKATVGDLSSACFATLAAHGVETFTYNLATDPAPARSFDAILLSEVIEHIPVPGHLALRRLREMLHPGAPLICSTPNLYRLRNVAFLALGRPIFDNFDLPSDAGAGHVLEYSAEHLRWQFTKAGYRDVEVRLREFAHVPNRRSDRLLAAAGRPLLRIPRFRNNLLATGVAP